jgi:hypothetical protein
MASPLYQGDTYDIDGTAFIDYGLDEITETTIDEQALIRSPYESTTEGTEEGKYSEFGPPDEP